MRSEVSAVCRLDETVILMSDIADSLSYFIDVVLSA